MSPNSKIQECDMIFWTLKFYPFQAIIIQLIYFAIFYRDSLEKLYKKSLNNLISMFNSYSNKEFFLMKTTNNISIGNIPLAVFGS